MSLEKLDGEWYITTACQPHHDGHPCPTCWRKSNDQELPSNSPRPHLCIGDLLLINAAIAEQKLADDPELQTLTIHELANHDDSETVNQDRIQEADHDRRS